MDWIMEARRRVRLYAAQQGHKGSPESRDHCITKFLDDLSVALTPAAILTLPPEHLGALYVDWHLLTRGGHAGKVRQEALLAGLSPNPMAFSTGLRKLAKQAEQPTESSPDKVVSIHERVSRRGP